jgi:hypothetical protein
MKKARATAGLPADYLNPGADCRSQAAAWEQRPQPWTP